MDVSSIGSMQVAQAQLDPAKFANAAQATQGLEQQEDTAASFEGMFVSLLLKEMRNTLPEGIFGSEGSDVLGGMFDQYMGQHMADSGSLGIKELVMANAIQADSSASSSSLQNASLIEKMSSPETSIDSVNDDSVTSSTANAKE